MPAKANDKAWEVAPGDYTLDQGLLVCPRALADTPGGWNDPRSTVMIEELLAVLHLHHGIDRNRVYLLGRSMGAIGGMHLGPMMPDRWAAVSCMSGLAYIGHQARASIDNLRNLSLLVQIGTKDLEFNRYPLTKAWVAAVQACAAADPQGYRVDVREHAGKGHRLDDADAPDWLAQQVRDPLPRRIVWRQPMLPPGTDRAQVVLRLRDRPDPAWNEYLRRRMYWLRNDEPQPDQRLVVERDDTGIRILAAEHLERITLLLDDRMCDLDRPVPITLPDGRTTATPVVRTAAALLRSLVEHRDPDLMCSAEVVVTLP